MLGSMVWLRAPHPGQVIGSCLGDALPPLSSRAAGILADGDVVAVLSAIGCNVLRGLEVENVLLYLFPFCLKPPLQIALRREIPASTATKKPRRRGILVLCAWCRNNLSIELCDNLLHQTGAIVNPS